MIEILVALAILGIALLAYAALGGRNTGGDREYAAFKGMELVHVERDLAGTTHQGIRVYGRPDRVYRDANGAHVPFEYKTRARPVVYASDVAQLSLYAWLLGKNGYRVGDEGYVLMETPHGVRLQRVKLHALQESERLVARYLAITEGLAQPKASPGRKCLSCGHRDRCRADGARRRV